jgi:hypothetical protein
MRRRRRVCSCDEILAVGPRAPRLVALPALALCIGLVLGAEAHAQDAATGGVPASEAAQPGATEPTPTEPTEPTATEPRAARMRVAVVLVGDANEEARLLAESVERAVGESLELPSDAGLRASLVGATGEDTIAPVVRDRRALGGSEAEDVPLLASLGDRADVRLLLVTRRRAGVRELVVFDVASRAFFEGSLALDAQADDARILRFVRARARAASGALEAPTASAEAGTERAAEANVDRALRPGPSTPGQPTPGQPNPGEGGEREPDWLELNWPYLLAGALLAGAAAFVIVYTVEDQGPTPTLRFRPGGTP